MAETVKIPGELESTATGNKVVDVANVKDKTQGNKTQFQINADVEEAIGADDVPGSIKGRIKENETALGEGGSVDQRIAEEGAKHYLKSETYTKSELNNMITTPNQEYVTVTSYASLPATGEADTIYRVSNYDGSQVDETVYSEYAWNGSQYVHLSTKTQIGEVFDISAYHATGGTLTTYVDLAAALDSNNGGGVPQSLQKGGMSIKFVQTSDNKYVQYRLMAAEWSTKPSDWQGGETSNVTLHDDESQGIKITSDDGTETLVEITQEYVDAKNLKSNGKRVLVESDLNGIATEEYVDNALENKQDKIDGLTEKSIVPSTDSQIIIADDNDRFISSIDAERKPNVEDEFIIGTDNYDDDTPVENEVLFGVNSEGARAKTFIADDFKNTDGISIVKDNYFEEAQFIPDMTSPNIGGPLCYNGDTKADSNFIVNAVVYPNGEIIACRRGGAVVKIAKDGTETTLMTIAGAGDWRGVFMDKDLNVYVSPHVSFDGSSMAMTDRGLYKLTYGQSAFVKVISLYDPNSDVPSETVQNDDTIWTMCQDRKGYLYAGVYSHSVRNNPAIYRSTDGGNTWTYYYNFITSGVCTTGRHIHVIIYNEYDNNLYCIVGEKNEIYCSQDNSTTWTAMGVQLEDEKGSAMIAVKDGLIVGSDSGYSCLMSKVYTNKSHKTTGRMWANTVFAIRRSDLTGWLYAFTKIDSSVNLTDYMPPIEAIDNPAVLEDWIDSDPRFLADWQKMYNYTKDYYPDDCIRPQHCAILRSKDDGETWEIIYKKFTTSAGAYGFPTTGYFRNGECLAGSTINVSGSLKFTNPIIISEGQHNFTDDGLDVDNSIFGKILANKIINN